MNSFAPKLISMKFPRHLSVNLNVNWIHHTINRIGFLWIYGSHLIYPQKLSSSPINDFIIQHISLN